MIVIEDIHGEGNECCLVYCVENLANSPPIGVGYIAAALKQKDVPYRFYTIVEKDVSKICEWIKGNKCSTYLFSVYDWNAAISISMIELIRDIDRDSKIIVGGLGCYATEEMFSKTRADVLVIGEGEVTIVELLDALAGRRPLSGVKGIAYKEGGKTIVTAEREATDINKTASPYILDVFNKRYKKAAYSFNRGCMFSCKYCYWGSPACGGSYRVKNKELAIKELSTIASRGTREIHSVASVFNFSTEYLSNISKMMDEKGLHFIWYDADCRADLMTEEQLKIMKQMGVREVGLGVETVNPVTQKLIEKNLDVEKVRSAMELLRKYKFKTHVSMQVGLPGEGVEDAKRTFEFVKSLGAVEVGIFHTRLQPGTALYDEMKVFPCDQYEKGFTRFADNGLINLEESTALIEKFFEEVHEITTKKLFFRNDYIPYTIKKIEKGYRMDIYLGKTPQGMKGVDENPKVINMIAEVRVHSDGHDATDILKKIKESIPRAEVKVF